MALGGGLVMRLVPIAVVADYLGHVDASMTARATSDGTGTRTTGSRTAR